VYYTYILSSEKDSSYYIGFTNKLQKRIRQHNSGKSKYTSKHRPYKLIYYEPFETKTEAIQREKYFKTKEGRDFFLRKIEIVKLVESKTSRAR